MSIYDPAETQFTLYTHNESPDGWKSKFLGGNVRGWGLVRLAYTLRPLVVYILKALELTYTSIYLDFLTSEQKAPSYTKINPNGKFGTKIRYRGKNWPLFHDNS